MSNLADASLLLSIYTVCGYTRLAGADTSLIVSLALFKGRSFRAPALLLPYNRAIKALRFYFPHDAFGGPLLCLTCAYTQRVSRTLFLLIRTGGVANIYT
jgi:hypothetical protein